MFLSQSASDFPEKIMPNFVYGDGEKLGKCHIYLFHFAEMGKSSFRKNLVKQIKGNTGDDCARDCIRRL